MGDIADMMMEGVLCIRCGTAFPGRSVSGHPRACRDCQREEAVDQYGNPKAQTLPEVGRSGKRSCPICGKRRKGLVQHMKDAHGAEPTAQKGH